ncbi:carboxymuconolactone decarboxylase family protein [Alkalihalobacillus pseudalcaliphilus]|uniref:carboxymuconolactone decarboxylase family protein n=1 Tax=Alkalihalobacillus pseudalcaliphilus TaxID=79884 RepID=UPI00064DF1F6|nr:carboxymuconolactone decarboxylase family protein [Alkalihalobacillus pseudalcaliphilus]KMK77590.1 alkylhydroperoxidase [Alkalihalobacillus pseudalcaliphilus]
MSNQQSDQTPIAMALQEYKEGVHQFSKKMPHIAKKHQAFTEACFEEGKLTKREKQLIALAVSVIAQDEYCMIYHTKMCLDEGCEEEEVLEAVAVSAAFGGGAVMSQAVTLVLESLSEFEQKQKPKSKKDKNSQDEN